MREWSIAWMAYGAACSSGDIGASSGAAADVGADPAGCRDEDGDGFGLGCSAGQDCNDADPALDDDCSILEVGVGADPWRPEPASGLEVDEGGALTLEGDGSTDDSVWIANTNEGTVSRLDAKTGREIGRYPSVLAGASGARPFDEACNGGDHTGNCPSRTAIDFRRDCWVANRAFGHQGTVSKIAAREIDCVDRNGNGSIDTSRDEDGDGAISPDEMVVDDECVLFTVAVGGLNGIPRALAIAPDLGRRSTGGSAWVGCNAERRAYELDGEDGHVIRSVDLPLNPYGALAGKVGGLVWFVNAGWQSDAYEDNPPSIVAVDFNTGVVLPRHEVESAIPGCVGTYGITLDLAGRVWTGGSPCEAVFRFDPRDESWLTVDLEGRGNTRGLVADAEGSIWIAHSRHAGEHLGNITSVDAATGLDPVFYSMPTGKISVGVDLDAEGRIWAVNQETHNASRIDPRTGEILEFPVGAKPYSYSDFTGHSLLLQFPQGTYSGLLEACGAMGASWITASWQGDVPAGASVELRVRTADTREALEVAPWYGQWSDSPADLRIAPGPVPTGAVMEYEITLRSLDGIAVPRVERLAIAYACSLQ
jgi:streptogramin lyase